MGYWRRNATHPQPPSMAVAFAGLQGGRPHSCSGQPVPEHSNAAFPAVRVKPPECPPVPASCCLFPGLTAIPAPRCTFSPPPQGHSTDPRAPPQLRPPAAKCRPARAAQALGPLGPRSGGRVRGKAPPPLTAQPRLAPPPCPCPCPAAAGAWEASPRSGAAPCAAGGDRRPGREEPPAVGNMAAASRAQVLRLYRALLRESQRFGGYNYRCSSLRPWGGKSAGWGGRGGGGRGSPALRARPELGGLGGGEGGLPRARWRWLAAGAAAPQGPALGRLQPCPGWARCLSPLPHAVPEVELKVWSTL